MCYTQVIYIILYYIWNFVYNYCETGINKYVIYYKEKNRKEKKEKNRDFCFFYVIIHLETIL